jgi:hypothetical protein
MKKLLMSFFVFVTAIFVPIGQFANSFAQGTAGADAKYEYRYLIDMPTAGILKKGFVGVTSDILPDGMLIGRLEVGVFDNVSFGISYGGGNIIGSGAPQWYKYPGVDIRYRIINESTQFPAITIGFDSQGKGQYFDSTSRYAIKSPGFFGSASKNFAFMGYLSLHATINYSLENKDGDDFLNLMVGAEKTIGNSVSIIGEYNFAFNDNSTRYYGSGNGYLNIGVRWAIGSGFTLGFDLRDLLDNKKWSPSVADRAIRLEYIKSIF